MIRFSDKDQSSTWYFNAYFLNVLKIIVIIYFVESKILPTTSYHGECPFLSPLSTLVGRVNNPLVLIYKLV